MVFVVVQNLDEIDQVVSTICKFWYFARLAWKRLKWETVTMGSTQGTSVHRNKSYPCTESSHMTYRSSKSVKWLQRYRTFSIFFKQKTAYEMLRSLVGSEMCIRDRPPSWIKSKNCDISATIWPISTTCTSSVSYTHLTLPTNREV